MKNFLTILLFSLILASCQREPAEMIELEPPIINQSTELVEGNVVGFVVTDFNEPLEGAKVNLNGFETITDTEGKFLFDGVGLYADGTFITIDKPGYHQATRKFYALEGEINVVGIEMIPSGFDDFFLSNSGKSVTYQNIEIDFPSGEYQLTNNESYSGEVKVDFLHIPQGSSNASIRMPGDLTGNDKNFDPVALSNFGIFKIGLESSSGDELIFPNEMKVDFAYAMNDQIFSESILSLWHLDVENGTWLESGEAELINGSYVGELNNSGYWMLGLAYDYVEIEGSLIDLGSSFNMTRLDIQNLSASYQNTTHTTMSGKFLTRLPKHLELEMAIFHECTVERQAENLGILNVDQILPPIEVEMALENIEISGRIENCNGEDTSRPYLKIDFGEANYMYRCDDQGRFDFSFSNCEGEEVSIIAIDDNQSTTSGNLLFPIHNQIDVGEIQTCSEIESGYDISYTNMDWLSNLESSITHEWTVSRVSAIEEKVIFSTKMFDEITGELFLTAAFVFVEGESIAEYQVRFKTQGFLISGECNLVKTDHGGVSSFRFEASSNNVSETNDGDFPGDVGTVNFNLVYYD